LIITWVVVIIVSAVIFGLGHEYQGTMGMLKTGAVGLVFSISYLAVGRNLWPLALAHALIDSLDFITHYFGG
jgi:membrane protease YdiL (CAAX protease family)